MNFWPSPYTKTRTDIRISYYIYMYIYVIYIYMYVLATKRSILPSAAVHVSSGGGDDVFPSLPPSLVGVAHANRRRRCCQYHVGDHTEWMPANVPPHETISFNPRGRRALECDRDRGIVPCVSLRTLHKL